jgi:hypothetical protein
MFFIIVRHTIFSQYIHWDLLDEIIVVTIPSSYKVNVTEVPLISGDERETLSSNQ